MIKKAKDLFFKHKEVISYLFFGALTTAVDFIAYWFLTRLLTMNETAANILAQFIAILFAYITNKLYVFESKTSDAKELFLQFAKFFSLRLVTLVLNSIMFTVMIEKLGIHDIVTKIVVSVVVIILNYIFSKLLVFTRKEKNNE